MVTEVLKADIQESLESSTKEYMNRRIHRTEDLADKQVVAIHLLLHNFNQFSRVMQCCFLPLVLRPIRFLFYCCLVHTLKIGSLFLEKRGRNEKKRFLITEYI